MNDYQRAHIAQWLLGLACLALTIFASVSLGVLVALVWLLPVVITTHLGFSRDRRGWMWGLFLGWLGVLILACMRPQHELSSQ